MLHLAIMGVLGVGALVWCIKNRAWELSVTVELPANQKAGAEEDGKAP